MAAPELETPPVARVLLVDDSEHDRRLCSRVLERAEEPYELIESPDGESALKRLREGEKFDLIVVDLNMPGMDGIRLIREADDLLRDTAVMVLTGSLSLDPAIQAVRLHVTDYVTKEPRDELREALPRRVANAVRQIRLIRENRRLEGELRLRLAHLEQIYQQMPEAIFATLTAEGTIAEINPQAAEFLGLEEGESAQGRAVEEVLTSVSPDLASTVGALLAKGKAARNVYAESGDRLFLVNLTPVEMEINDQGEPARWVLTLRDVSPEKTAAPSDGQFDFRGILGRDPSMLEVFDLIKRVAPRPTSVLITGPTGVGKELVARAIHAESERADKPFIAINCTALSREILESELFGHLRGSFTGAISSRKGRFREADGGTLFLDEIGDTAESFQTKLLRAVESGEIEPVGQDRPIKVDVRILCATNRDLSELVRQGKFREDLFYRINVVHIDIPPLAARPGDLALLIGAIRNEFNRKFNKAVKFISRDAMRALARHDWPGNVRELRHVLEHAFVVADGPTITKTDLPQDTFGAGRGAGRRASSAPAAAETGGLADHDSARPEDEVATIKWALEQTQGNIGRAAELLNMHRTTLWRKMRQFDIKAEAVRL